MGDPVWRQTNPQVLPVLRTIAAMKLQVRRHSTGYSYPSCAAWPGASSVKSTGLGRGDGQLGTACRAMKTQEAPSSTRASPRLPPTIVKFVTVRSG
jgi:hypothetical protein